MVKYYKKQRDAAPFKCLVVKQTVMSKYEPKGFFSHSKPAGKQINLNFKPDPEMELTEANFNKENWQNKENTKFDACAAIRKALQAVAQWGEQFNRDCTYRYEGAENQKTKRLAWHTRRQAKLRAIANSLPDKLAGEFLGCKF